MSKLQPSLWEDERLTLKGAIDLSLASLTAYGAQYPHWVVAYSGGKDSSATVSFVAWAIRTGKVPAPQSMTILYADTRMELPPLQQTALRLLDALRGDGFNAQVVSPHLDDRFYVYMFGRGITPPKVRFRWCTPQLKIEPMHAALADLRQRAGQKLLMLTGVRLGESAARDQRIAVSCSKDSGECGQGWMQVATPEAIADTLAPLLHWRLCHVYDWLYFEEHPYVNIVRQIAAVYGDDEVRTGCVGCNLASEDTALKRLLKKAEWQHLAPLAELKPLYTELARAKWRKRKSEPVRIKGGQLGKNAQRLGPLTMEAREYGFDRVLNIQARAGVDLINLEEALRIRELIALNTWPLGWDGGEVAGDVPLDAIRTLPGGESVTVQPLLVR